MRWCLAFLFLLPSADAVKLRWKIASQDFVRYKAFRYENDTPLEDSGRHVGLFGYEIEEGTTYHPRSMDWMEIPLILGYTFPEKTLKIGQSADLDFLLDRGWDYEPLRARGTVERIAVDLGVRLKVTARLTPARNKRLDRQRAVTEAVFTATVDASAERGVVTRLDFEFTITFAAPDKNSKPETVKRHDLIELVEILPPRHARFDAEVNEAIDRGIACLWRSYDEKEGHWGSHYDHRAGPTALALLTILKGSTDRKDPRLPRALKWLLEQPLQFTYGVGISMMALDAWYSPVESVDKRALDPAHKKWMTDAARWIESKIRAGWWGYPDGGPDFSNTQYAVLGLLSASRCGVAVDDRVLDDALTHYVRCQQKRGPRLKLKLVGASSLDRTTAELAAEARGWGYREEPETDWGPTHSMSAGAIGSVTILDALLRRARSPKYSGEDYKSAQAALRDGWGWFQQNWGVKHNLNRGRDPFYYLYAFERAAMLTGVVRVGGHDWYWEGATWLVSNQSPDGGWGHFYDTCFAVLFLKRATIRVTTPGGGGR